MNQISAPVGRWEDPKVIARRGNKRNDILKIQQLLKNASKQTKNASFDPGSLDGLIARAPRSSSTVRAIRAFQGKYCPTVDGRVDVGGTTWKKLTNIKTPKENNRPVETPLAIGRADFYYIAAKNSTRERTDGRFYIPARNFSCAARSGSRTLHPLPDGEYQATNFRTRTMGAMIRDGIGFSVDLSDKYDPDLERMRTLLRIHPDGGAAGTAGCVGIMDQVRECRDLLEEMLPTNVPRNLIVLTVENASQVPNQVWQGARLVEQNMLCPQ